MNDATPTQAEQPGPSRATGENAKAAITGSAIGALLGAVFCPFGIVLGCVIGGKLGARPETTTRTNRPPNQ